MPGKNEALFMKAIDMLNQRQMGNIVTIYAPNCQGFTVDGSFSL